MHFIILYGILRLGGLLLVLVLISIYISATFNGTWPSDSTFVFLTALPLALGVFTAAQMWSAQERGYLRFLEYKKIPASEIKPAMPAPELLAVFKKISRRLSVFGILILPLGAFILAAFCYAPLDPVPDALGRHQIEPWFLLLIVVVEFGGMWWLIRAAIRKARADCHKFGAICPRCGSALAGMGGFDWVKSTGCCPNCNYKIMDVTL